MLFGAHVSISGGIATAIDRAEELGCDAAQVFTQSPQMWKPTVRTPEELAQFRTQYEASTVRSVVCHALYLVNLGSTDREIRKKSVIALRASLETAAAIGAEGVMFHVGSHLGKGLGPALRRIVPPLRELLALTTDKLWLLLENSAGAGGTIGRSVDELAVIAEKLDHHPRLGLCLDSCHWWASGVDITDADALDDALADIEGRMGPGRVRCLHINDAAVGLGSNRDRHASLGEGTIGEGMATFLAHPLFQDIPAILETSGPGRHLRRRARTPESAPPQGHAPSPEALTTDARSMATSVRRRSRRLQASARPKAGSPRPGSAPAEIRLADYSTVAKIRKLGLASGSSWNSGFRQPSSSPRCS